MTRDFKIWNSTATCWSELWVQPSVSCSADLSASLFWWYAGRCGFVCYVGKPGNIYTRITNPTAAFEERIAALEGGVGALATASGMAAIYLYNLACWWSCSSSINYLRWNLQSLEKTLPRCSITTFVDVDNLEEVEQLSMTIPSLFWLKPAGNPWSVDLEKLAEIAQTSDPLVSDNTFATPYLINVFSHGVDVAIHSATNKFIGGHGTTIGGVIVDSSRWLGGFGKFPQFVEEAKLS